LLPSRTFAPASVPGTNVKGPRTGVRCLVDDVYMFLVRLCFMTFNNPYEVGFLLCLNVTRLPIADGLR
jgi:hypothetical protein